jgi:excisionase family DNA binding protein
LHCTCFRTALDPDNRLVAGELERRWNETLANVHALEEQLAQHDTGPALALSNKDRERLLALGSDLSRAWDEAGATIETRKKIVRLLIAEIIADVVGDKLELVIHWHGGDHTCLTAKRNRVGQNQWVTDADVVDLVRVLARQMPDDSIAAVLNRSGKSTGRGNSWTRTRVCSLRYQNEIAPYREGERADRGEVTIEEAAAVLTISASTVRRMISNRILPAQQLCKGAPWIIRSCDLERKDVRAEARARRLRCPSSGDPRQESLDF